MLQYTHLDYQAVGLATSKGVLIQSDRTELESHSAHTASEPTVFTTFSRQKPNDVAVCVI